MFIAVERTLESLCGTWGDQVPTNQMWGKENSMHDAGRVFSLLQTLKCYCYIMFFSSYCPV